MLNKILPLCCAFCLLTGCSNAHRIETASVIENVCVSQSDDKLCYTFFLLEDSDKPHAVTIQAASFEEARKLAEEQFIPHVTLAKLELLLIEQEVSSDVLRRDIDYISTQAYFSPIAHVALCDEATLRRLKRDSGAQELIERQIDLLHGEQPEVKTNYLSVFNACARGERFAVPLITTERELCVSSKSVMPTR